MKNFFFVLFLFSFEVFGQIENPKATAMKQLQEYPEKDKGVFRGNIIDFVLRNDTVFVLTDKNAFWVFALKTRKKKKIATQVQKIYQDQQGQLFFIHLNGQVKLYESLDNQINIIKITETFDYFVSNRNKEYFIVTPRGVKDLQSQKIYLPNTTESCFRTVYCSHTGRLLSIPSSFLLDSQNRLWIGFDGGEWGCQLAMFDTQNKQFIDLYLERCYSLSVVSWGGLSSIMHIKDIFEGKNKDIYVNSSITQMGWLRSKMIKFKDHIGKTVNPYPKIECDTTFFKEYDTIEPQTEEEEKMISQKIDSLVNFKDSILRPYKIEETMYLGSGKYNVYDQKVYYYCEYGFFRQKESENMIKEYEPYLKPRLKWRFGLSHSVGYEMNVTKMTFLSATEMLFLTTTRGLGYFDGKKVVYYH